METTHTPRIRLTHETLFTLQNWLTANKEILTQHPFRALAEKATADLGFEVSYISIDRISKLLNIPAGLPAKQSRKVALNNDSDTLVIAQALQIVLDRLSLEFKPLGEIITRLKAAK